MQYLLEPLALENIYRVLCPAGVAIVDTCYELPYQYHDTSRSDMFKEFNARGCAIEEFKHSPAPGVPPSATVLLRKNDVPLKFPAAYTSDAMRALFDVGFGNGINDIDDAYIEVLRRIEEKDGSERRDALETAMAAVGTPRRSIGSNCYGKGYSFATVDDGLHSVDGLFSSLLSALDEMLQEKRR
jgi:hypothetical protein